MNFRYWSGLAERNEAFWRKRQRNESGGYIDGVKAGGER